MAALVECQAVSRAFELAGQTFHALREVDLTIERGELVAIVGASGSGKSTLLNAIGGLDRPTSGSVRVAGEDLALLGNAALADLRNRRIGFIFQQFNLLARYDARRNVELPLVYAGWARAERHRRADELLQRLGLPAHIHKLPTQMSGGQQQRVAIARALATDPPLLLADEPTGALDSTTGREVMDLLIGLNRDQGTTVVVVTHDRDLAERCGRIIVCSDGRIVEDRAGGGSR